MLFSYDFLCCSVSFLWFSIFFYDLMICFYVIIMIVFEKIEAITQQRPVSCCNLRSESGGEDFALSD